MDIVLSGGNLSPDSGGVGNYIYNVTASLRERGHAVTVFGRSGLEDYEGCELVSYSSPRGSYLVPQIQRRFIERYIDFEPDVWIGRTQRPTQAAIRRVDAPVIYIPPSIRPNIVEIREKNANSFLEASKFKFYGEVEAKSQRNLCRNSDKIVVISKLMKRDLVSEYGIPPEKISVIYPGIDVDVYRPREEDIRQRYGIGEDEPLVVTVAVLQPQKNISLLLRAAAELPNDINYLFVGDGSMREEYEALASQLGIGDQCHFVGRQKDVVPFFSSADVSVLPSSYEPFGQVILESMACGTPVITLEGERIRVGGNEVIAPNETGLLASPSSSSLAEEIQTFFERVDRAAMSEACREAVLDNYQLSDHVSALLEEAKSVSKTP